MCFKELFDSFARSKFFQNQLNCDACTCNNGLTHHD